MKHTLSETLDLAADLVRDKGWTQGASGWEGPRVCLEGAIAAASGLDVFADGIGTMAVNQCPAGRAVRRHLCYYGMLWAWNDREGRTAVEVEGVLRSAAAAERAKEQAAVAAAESVADSFHRSLDRALAVTS